MSIAIAVIGTESFHDNYDYWNVGGDLSDITNQLSDWWESNIENSPVIDGPEATFTEFSTEIPEDDLSTSDMSSRRHSASSWIDSNIVTSDNYATFQIIDFIEETGDGWPLGRARLGRAMTTHIDRNGITNAFRFRDESLHRSYFFQDVEMMGTVFHELLHTFDVEHSDGGVLSNDEASFITPFDTPDDLCTNLGDSTIRTDFVSSCSANVVEEHVNDHD